MKALLEAQGYVVKGEVRGCDVVAVRGEEGAHLPLVLVRQNAARRIHQLAAGPRPVVQFSATSRIVIIGQAPGSRVHASGVPFDDASGDRLREWMGVDKATFYDEYLPDRIVTWAYEMSARRDLLGW